MTRNALFVGLCFMAASGLASGETVSIPVTSAHERIVIALWDGDIAVNAGPEDALLVISNCSPRERETTEPGGGLRSLRGNAQLPGIVVGDEVITIRTYEDDPSCSVDLAVPRRLDLHARVNFAGSISVDSWRGRLLAWSADGDVNVVNHSGSLSVTAMNGDANVSINDAGLDADSAITSANGTLMLTVSPKNVPALRAQARWGDIQTDLDAAFREILEAGGTWFATERVDGAPLLTLRNLNRDIIIQKSRGMQE